MGVDVQLESQPIQIRVGHTGYYIEEATGERIDLFPEDEITAITYYEEGDSLDVTVSGFTHLAAAYAQCLAQRRGENMLNAITASASAMSSVLGHEILSTRPVNPTLASSEGLVLNKGLQYGLVAAGVSQMMKEIAEDNGSRPHIKNFRSIDFYRYGYRDLAEDRRCALDGLMQDGDGNLVSLGVGQRVFDSNTYRADLARAAIEFLRTEHNRTAVTVGDYMIPANLIAGAEHDILFANERPEPLVDEGPNIVLLYPDGQVFNGIASYEVEVSDFTEVRAVDLYINGEMLGSATDPQNPVFPVINTHNYVDGDYTIKIVAENIQGLTSEKEHEVVFWNSGPAVQSYTPTIVNTQTVEIAVTLISPRGLGKVYIDGKEATVSDQVATVLTTLELGFERDSGGGV